MEKMEDGTVVLEPCEYVEGWDEMDASDRIVYFHRRIHVYPNGDVFEVQSGGGFREPEFRAVKLRKIAKRLSSGLKVVA